MENQYDGHRITPLLELMGYGKEKINMLPLFAQSYYTHERQMERQAELLKSKYCRLNDHVKTIVKNGNNKKRHIGNISNS